MSLTLIKSNSRFSPAVIRVHGVTAREREIESPKRGLLEIVSNVVVALGKFVCNIARTDIDHTVVS